MQVAGAPLTHVRQQEPTAPVTAVETPAPVPADKLEKSAKPVSWGPFLYREDVLPTAAVIAGVGLALAPFVVPMSIGATAACIATSLPLRLLAANHQHHHSHLKVFTNKPLNKLYDTVLMLAAGNVTTGWEMQHCKGHHSQYLDHENDVAGTKRFTAKGPLRQLIFTIAGDAMSAIDSWRIAGTTKEPTKVRARLVGELALQAAVNGALLCVNAPLALASVVIPNALLRWSIFWHSFDQHDTAEGNDVFDGSVNRSGKLQELLLNVGHHTAHHAKMSLHWSRLPALTEKMRDKIPPHLMR